MILIVGGAGYIGSHTNKMLSNKGYKTIVFDNLNTSHRESAQWGEFIKGDLSNIIQLRSLFDNYKISAVFHFAAHAYVGESVQNPEKYYINNISNTLNLLKVMREFEVRDIIFSSSCATYGEPESLPLNEDHSEKPINPYGKTKLVVENILKDYAHAYGTHYVSLRYFNAAGADPDGNIGESHNPETHLIPLVIQTALQKKGIVQIFGDDYDTKDGTCIRDYIHVNDLADAHIKAFEYLRENKQKSEIINLGTGVGYSVKEIISSVEKITKRIVNVKVCMRRTGDPPTLISDNKKAKELLDWIPHYDMNAIISHAIGWHKNPKF